MFTGVDDIMKLDIMDMWNYTRQTKYIILIVMCYSLYSLLIKCNSNWKKDITIHTVGW